MTARRCSSRLGRWLLFGAAFAAVVAALLAALLGSPGAGAASKAGPTTYTASLQGVNEVPPNASPATGFATVVLNAAETQITVDANWTGLTAPATAGHIHGPAPPGTNAPVLFPFSSVPAATSGTIPQQTFAITAAQVTDLKAGNYYVNIHTSTFPGGEIRDQLALSPTAVYISGASAMRTARGILVRWRTASELGSLGFNVYRQDSRLVRLNGTLIAATAGAAGDRVYSWLDRHAPAGRATYRLQAVSASGSRSWVATMTASGH